VADLVAGVDGCRAGWVVVLTDSRVAAGDRAQAEVALARDFRDVLTLTRGARVVGVDMPIGLLDAAAPGGRECDRHARRLLGRDRACSVFSPPARAALARPSYRGALSANRASSAARLGISIECYGLFPRLREVDEALSDDLTLAERVTEIHPELSFRALAGGPVGLSEPKRSTRGLSRRVALLRPVFPRLARAVKARAAGIAADDVLDAHAVAWSAARVARDTAVCLPAKPAPRDARGLPMAIWY
jgi:predicted RNase H-like nuclease